MVKNAKVVIDTNVIISAFGWSGKPGEILSLMTNGAIQNFTSFEILDELRRVISYPKLGFREELQAEILEIIYNASIVVSLHEALHIINNDPDDNMILQCALTAKVDYIISGDKHLLELGNLGEVTILTPDDFLKKWSAINEDL